MTTDAMVHAAKPVYLKLAFAVVYGTAYDRTTVNTELERILAIYFEGLGFGTRIEASDILQQAHNVPGIDNIRFISTEAVGGATAYQEVTSTGTLVQTFATGSPGRATDTVLNDNQVPLLYDVVTVTKAANTFGTM